MPAAECSMPRATIRTPCVGSLQDRWRHVTGAATIADATAASDNINLPCAVPMAGRPARVKTGAEIKLHDRSIETYNKLTPRRAKYFLRLMVKAYRLTTASPE